MTKHIYIPSIDYINDLKFEYLEIYSFQRGEIFEEMNNVSRPEYERLRIKKEKNNSLTGIDKKEFMKLHGFFGVTQYLVNDKGQFHPTSTKTHVFQVTNPFVEKLKSILQTEIKDVPEWMCGPIYRDAIVFYDKSNKIVSVLNICLSCRYMETKMFSHINSDNLTYDLLRQFFIDLGHEIEPI